MKELRTVGALRNVSPEYHLDKINMEDYDIAITHVMKKSVER